MTDSTPATAPRRCPWCRQFVRPVTVSDRLVYPVHSRVIVDEVVSCSGGGEVVDDGR